MPTHLINALIPLLPRVSEKDGDFYAVKRDSLITLISEQCEVSLEVAENTVNLCERLLESLSVLDQYYLQQGEWCFISFPAQLMAHSVLNTLADKESHFFESRTRKPHFWKTDAIGIVKKELQYLTLKHFEQARFRLHENQSAKPIRYVHVAWALIKIDDHILFHKREDTKRRFDKTAGDYGLVGGRVDQHDFCESAMEMPQLLSLLQSNQREKITPALKYALIRTLNEKTGLIHSQHFEYKFLQELKPYQQVQGAAPNYALTDYFISLFSIELTLEGLCYLQQKVKKNKNLVWFDLDSVEKSKTVDEKMAYINALQNDDKFTKKTLRGLTPSFYPKYLMSDANLIFPNNYKKVFMKGVAGKEKAFIVNCDQQTFSVLLGLAAHQHASDFADIPYGAQLHPYGWVEVSKDCLLLPLLLTLTQCGLPIESQKNRYFRLSIPSEKLFFADDFFSWSISPTPPILSIIRTKFNTALGNVKTKKLETSISKNLSTNLSALAAKTLQVDPSSFKDNYRNSVIIDKELGLLGLVRGTGNCIKISCSQIIMT